MYRLLVYSCIQFPRYQGVLKLICAALFVAGELGGNTDEEGGLNKKAIHAKFKEAKK